MGYANFRNLPSIALRRARMPQSSAALEPRRSVGPMIVDSQLTASILADFRAGTLTPVKDFVEYYCEFLGRHPGGGDYSGNERYLTVSTDGQLIFTNGRVVGSLDLLWRKRLGPRQTDVVISIPYQLRLPPVGATVF